ncbi:MAG: cytochrome P450 [Actinomycetota bacterium]
MPTLQELILSGQVSFFALTRHADVSAALRHPHMSSDQDNWEGAALLTQQTQPPALSELFAHWMLFMDPPDHTRVRSLVNKAFTARSVERMRPRIQQITDELLDQAAERGEMEVMEDFAFPLPIRVICDMLRVPAEEHARFRSASQTLAATLDVGEKTQEVLDEWEVHARPFVDYMKSLIAERRKEPGEDLLSALIMATDEEDRLTEGELLGTVSLVLGAGFETTMNLIGNALYTLLRHPDELDRLRKDPSLAASTIEEVLRFEPPVQATARVSLVDTTIGDTPVRCGQQGLIMLASANRDTTVFDDPQSFDVGRAPNPHLTFGGGHHFCPGAALARLEGQIAIGALVQRFPNLELVAEPEWRQTVTLHGLKELHIRL